MRSLFRRFLSAIRFFAGGGGGGCCHTRALPSSVPFRPPASLYDRSLFPASSDLENPFKLLPSHIKNNTTSPTQKKHSRRIELVQDLGFPAAAHRLKLSPDGQFLFATGTHAPRVRVYELSQLSMKFERHFDAEVVDCQI